MADISAFPAIRNVLAAGNNIFNLTATTAVKAGQVVAINATGVSMAVDPAVATAGSQPLGVAIYDAAAGALCAIASVGCIVYVANADDTTGIDAGDLLVMNDNAVKGTVSTSLAVGSASTPQMVIGIAMDDIAGGATGRMLVTLGSLTAHA